MILAAPHRPSSARAAETGRSWQNLEASRREAEDYRGCLHESRLAQVEKTSVSAWSDPPSGYESRHQLVLPYYGLFAYTVGRKTWLLDPNKTLLISPGWEYRDEHPVAGLGHSALLINPARDLLDEVCWGLKPDRHAGFVGASRLVSTRLRLLIHQLLFAQPGVNDPLQLDEWAIFALREGVAPSSQPSRTSSKVVDRAKQMLHAHSCARLSLDEVAQGVGVTPVYLTQQFTRAEGIPLYQYQLRLRLSRALLELPHCNDITGLALDLGFCTHSHFTHVFKTAFGMTPSQYRARVGSDGHPLGLIKHLQRPPYKVRRAA